MISKEEAFKEILHYVKNNGMVSNSNLIHYFKDNVCYFQYDIHTKTLFVNQKVWLVLEKTYQMKTIETMDFIVKQIEEHWKIIDVNPLVAIKMPQYNEVVFKDVKDLKTWEEICLHTNRSPHDLPDVSKYDDKHKKHAIANFKLTICAEVRRGSWTPNYADRNQQKWYPYFEWNTKGKGSCVRGFVFLLSHSYGDNALTYVGGRLCFGTEKESDNFGKDFIELYNDLLSYT